MVLKSIDDKSKEISTLKKLHSRSSSDAQKKLIAQDLSKLENGYKSEMENAYYLDFEFSDKERTIVLHDVRLEHEGLVAQIDHILISMQGIEVLESKSFDGVLTIGSDNSLNVDYKGSVRTFPNPIEQNNRHAKVVQKLIKDKFNAPLRLKATGVKVKGKVLLNPKTTISNEILPEGFARSDSFASARWKEFDEMGNLEFIKNNISYLNKEQMKEIAKILMLNHKPVHFDYTKKYKIKAPDKAGKIETASDEVYENKDVEERECPRCKKGTLVQKKRMNHKYASKYKSDVFIGCNAFPKCRYTEEVCNA